MLLPLSFPLSDGHSQSHYPGIIFNDNELVFWIFGIENQNAYSHPLNHLLVLFQSSNVNSKLPLYNHVKYLVLDLELDLSPIDLQI